MEASRAALIQLVVGDSIIVGGEAKHRDPLITILRDMIYPSSGKGSASGGGDGGVLNTAALDLYDHIDGTVRSALNEWHRSPHGDLEEVLERMHDAIHVEAATWMPAEDAERYYARFPTWVARILDLIDPPHVKEFPGECVECHETHHVADGVVNVALAASIRPGWAVMVECRACGALWSRQEELTALAEHIGADVDWATLWELGSATSTETRTIGV